MHNLPKVTVGGLIIAPDGNILLVQSKKWHNLYSVPGGKVEMGESREEAFIREVWEETSLKVTNIRFAIVQDCIFSEEFWKKDHFVMNDFIADLDASSFKTDVKLNQEADQYLWIQPEKALKLSLHRECRRLIEWYLKQKSHQLSQSNVGIIGIHQHQVNCIVGVHPEEREQKQLLLINIKIKIDLSKSFGSSHVEDTIDYNFLAKLSTELAEKNHYVLLESFANDILEQCMARTPANWAYACIQKPAAIPTAAYAYVELERYR